MAAHGWGSNDTVEMQLHDSGHGFDFYQAVRILELLYPDRISVGEGSDPEREIVRFQARVSLEFPASDLFEVKRPESKNAAPEVVVNFLGLAGAHGPMPPPYTELVLERSWRKDTGLKDFLDIFNHRLVSILYRARKYFRLGFELKRPDRSYFAGFFFCLIGLGTKNLRRRMKIQDRALLNYTGILNQHPRSMKGLEMVLADYFEVPVKGRQLCGRWHNIVADQISLIGPSGRNRTLGLDMVLGERIWDQQGIFEIIIGPLPLDEFLDLLPLGTGFTPLCEMTRFYAGVEYEFDFLLHLRREEVPRLRLGGPDGARLKWTSWLFGGKFPDELGRVRLSARWSSIGIKKEAPT